MSWQSRGEYFRRLESQAEEGSVTIPQLLKDDSFLNALGQQLPKLSELVSNNVKELIEVTIGLKAPAQEVDVKRYLMALVSHNTKLTDALTKNQEIVNFLTNAITQNIDYSRYFRILQYAIDSGEFLSKVDTPGVFFNALVDKIQNSSVFQFLTTLCARRLSINIEWLANVEADTVLISRMYSEELTVSSCLKLLNCILNTQEANKLTRRLTTHKNFNLIFETGIDAPTVEISELSFRILIQMINISDDKQESNETSQYEQIMDSLDECCQKMCEFVLRDNEFLGDKYNAIELIRTVVVNRTVVEQCVFDVAKLLFQMFFEQPTNTFLHKSFLQLLQSLLKLDTGYQGFIEGEKILEKLISEHTNQTPISTTYHGFIITISYELASKISADEMKIPEEWTAYVNQVVNPTIKRYSTNYGGRVPRAATLDALGGQAHFLEKPPDDDDGFEEISDSNSDEYEEEDEVDKKGRPEAQSSPNPND